MTIHPIDVIQHKRDGLALSAAEIEAFIHALVHRTPENPTPTDAQAAALLMAIFLRGLNPVELAALTQAMRFSGETLDTSSLNAFTVDKHSTGGVGDKTSLLIAPIVAAAGLYDPMISGRSLGHTGGTLDKLETIPNFRTQLPLPEFLAIVRACGFAMAGQTPTLVPADRILYALRDHTGTVESPYLITASIMSKKLAAGLNALVLDVKTGSGAFMSRYEDAQLLARLMVETGNLAGTRTVALLTSMDQPLGRFSGNWVEVWECIDILKGIRHPMSADLIELSTILAGHMLFLGNKAPSPEAGAILANLLLLDGSAYQHFLHMTALQTASPGAAITSPLSSRSAAEGSASPSPPDTPVPHSSQPHRDEWETPAPYLPAFANPSAFHRPGTSITIHAKTAGYLASTDCTQIGWAVQRLGAGRTRPGDPVSAHAGIEMHVKIGDRIAPGQPLVTLFAETHEQTTEPFQMIAEALHISTNPPTPIPLIHEIITQSS